MILFLSDIATNSFHDDPEEEREKGQLRAECMRGFPKSRRWSLFRASLDQENLSELMHRVKKGGTTNLFFITSRGENLFIIFWF
jgi:hypothetical protein